MLTPLATAVHCAIGALDVEHTVSGVVFHRAPLSAITQMNDASLYASSAVPSGVHLAILTDATSIEIRVALTRTMAAGTVPAQAVFDLVVDGHLRAPTGSSAQNLVIFDVLTGTTTEHAGDVAIVAFDIAATPADRRVEIWFPTDVTLELRDVRPVGATYFRPAPPEGPMWIHHGSSISQCSEADRPTSTWPAIVARKAGMTLTNLGLSGQCHLDQFMARAIRGLPADLISLELGINIVNGDSMRERAFIPAFNGFLDTVRDGHADAPILILMPIICPMVEERPGPTVFNDDLRFYAVDRPAALAEGALSLTRIRALLEHQVQLRRDRGDANLHLLDGLGLFGPGDTADLPDGLHPNPAGYRRMAKRFLAQRPTAWRG
jgi:lysophospholipase L1-like esterase